MMRVDDHTTDEILAAWWRAEMLAAAASEKHERAKWTHAANQLVDALARRTLQEHERAEARRRR